MLIAGAFMTLKYSLARRSWTRSRTNFEKQTFLWPDSPVASNAGAGWLGTSATQPVDPGQGEASAQPEIIP